MTPNPPYIPYRQPHQTDQIDGVEFYWYIKPQSMEPLIQALSDQIKLADYDHVFYVLQGGLYLYDQLTCLQSYPRDYAKQAIEYHRHPVHAGRLVDKPLPECLTGPVLIIDDVWDTGRTAQLMVDDLNSQPGVTKIDFAVLAHKLAVPGQLTIPDVNFYPAVMVDNVWLGGCGMDLGVKGAVENKIRRLGGLIVKKS